MPEVLRRSVHDWGLIPLTARVDPGCRVTRRRSSLNTPWEPGKGCRSRCVQVWGGDHGKDSSRHVAGTDATAASALNPGRGKSPSAKIKGTGEGSSREENR